jgi:hypothetical protein
LRAAGATGSKRTRPRECPPRSPLGTRGTRKRDRFEKPGLYADAGIPYYWRVEKDPRVHVSGLREGAYKLLADSETMLKVDEPFPIALPVQAITP